MEKPTIKIKGIEYPIQDEVWELMLSTSKERDQLRDTLQRIATAMPAVAPDSHQNDDTGEIYHLLRECGAIKEGGE